MKMILKYTLDIKDYQEIETYEFPQYLCVQNQNNKICLWLLVDTDNKIKPLKFKIYGTGNPIKEEYMGVYLGSIQTNNGNFVSHIFWES